VLYDYYMSSFKPTGHEGFSQDVVGGGESSDPLNNYKLMFDPSSQTIYKRDNRTGLVKPFSNKDELSISRPIYKEGGCRPDFLNIQQQH